MRRLVARTRRWGERTRGGRNEKWWLYSVRDLGATFRRFCGALLRATAYAPTTPTPSTLRFAWVWGAARGSSWRWLWPPRHKAEFAAFTAQPATCYCCYYVAGWLSRRDALLDDDCYSALPNSQYRSLDFLTRTWQAEVPVLAENSPVLCQLRHAHGMATPSWASKLI